MPSPLVPHAYTFTGEELVTKVTGLHDSPEILIAILLTSLMNRNAREVRNQEARIVLMDI